MFSYPFSMECSISNIYEYAISSFFFSSIRVNKVKKIDVVKYSQILKERFTGKSLLKKILLSINMINKYINYMMRKSFKYLFLIIDAH